MEPKVFCCEALALAFYQRQAFPSMDEDCDWNVRGADAFAVALENIHFCPYCGTALPKHGDMEQA